MFIQAMPFVPGVAEGALSTDTHAADVRHVLLIDYAELETFRARPAGLIVIGGAPLSHPMTQLQSYGIPTVVLGRRQAAELETGETIHLDGGSGQLHSAAAGGTDGDGRVPGLRAGSPVHTADGVPIELRGSITGAEGAREAVSVGAAGIGMVRTEYLTPPHGRPPDVAFYREALGEICAAAGDLPVTFRLLDISVDKRPPWLGEMAGMAGLLGMQGSRLFAVEPVRSVVRAQVAAIAELASRYDLRVLIPYVASPEEFGHWRQELGAWLPETVPVGIMAETPAAALAMPEWRERADLVSIGCNDLMQCLFGADRDIPEVAGYLDPYSPPLLRFLRIIAGQAGADCQRVQLCGLLQQLPGVLPLLIGLGYRRFSMAPRLIPTLARVVQETDTAEAQGRAASVCEAPDSDAVHALLGLEADARPEMPWSRI
ncbi:putative PEP-binding protein [Aquisalimonas sp.]|uniref:putative PEP-binding protein n=1 Tax=unclassified Aquisalimonas TaxID=2644645 RepID=UPI0025C322E0|nr:putative PEP-binding protein [Aquisalimonas sp.]